MDGLEASRRIAARTATAKEAHIAHVLTNPVNRLGLFDRARAAIAQYRSYRQTVTELQALGNRELSDLGLSRSTIRDVAYSSAYGF